MVWLSALLLSAISAIAWSMAHAHELFFISARRGRLLVVRGRVPQSLLEAIDDVLTRAAARDARVAVRLDGGRARCVVRGVDEHVAQRLRNVVGTFPLARLRAASPPARRNIGQRLGIEWLAWWLS